MAYGRNFPHRLAWSAMLHCTQGNARLRCITAMTSPRTITKHCSGKQLLFFLLPFLFLLTRIRRDDMTVPSCYHLPCVSEAPDLSCVQPRRCFQTMYSNLAKSARSQVARLGSFDLQAWSCHVNRREFGNLLLQNGAGTLGLYELTI